MIVHGPIQFDERGLSQHPVATSPTGAPVYLYFDRAAGLYRHVLKTKDQEGNDGVVFVDQRGVPPPETDPSLGIGMLAGLSVGLAVGLLPGLIAGATGMLLAQYAKPSRVRRIG